MTASAATAAKRALRAAHRSAAPPAAGEGDGAGTRWVTMSGALTRAAHGLSLPEKRIIVIAVSKLDSKTSLPALSTVRSRVTADEYADLAQCEMHTAYEALQDAAKALFERRITFYEPSHKRGQKDLSITRVQMRWISTAKYQDGEAWIEVTWNPDLMPHLVGLRKNFSSYQLQQASALRSVYSWRLLEMLNKYKSTGWAEYAIEDFNESMEVTEKMRADFGQIRRRVIDPAIKELSDKDNWIIKLTTIKAGRKITRLRFDFERNPQMSLI